MSTYYRGSRGSKKLNLYTGNRCPKGSKHSAAYSSVSLTPYDLPSYGISNSQVGVAVGSSCEFELGPNGLKAKAHGKGANVFTKAVAVGVGSLCIGGAVAMVVRIIDKQM